MEEASLPSSEVAESVTKGEHSTAESLIETTQGDLTEGVSDEQFESLMPNHESEPTDADEVLDGSVKESTSVVKENDVASVEPTAVSGDVVIGDANQTIVEVLPSSMGAPEVTVNDSDGKSVADVDISTSASPVESSVAVSTEHSPEASHSSSQPDTPNAIAKEITSTEDVVQDVVDVVDEGSKASHEEASVVAENESVEAIPTDADSATQAPSCDISPSSSPAPPTLATVAPMLATVAPTLAQEELSAAVDEALAEVDLDDAVESGPPEDANIDEREPSPSEDFFDVAAARIAELSLDPSEEALQHENYASDTPTPRLVIIAENIDSVSGDQNGRVEDGSGGGSGSGSSSSGGEESGPCEVCDDEGDDAVDDSLTEPAPDSGVADIDGGSSTTVTTPTITPAVTPAISPVTTPDDSSNVFSPKKQPAASLSSSLLDRKQSQASPKTPNSSFIKPQPLLSVRCTNAAVDGDSIRFAILATRESTDQEFVVDRCFEDFEWLHECMTTTNDFPGLIFPPLPKKPNAEALIQESERRSRRASSVGRSPSMSSNDGLPSLSISSKRRLPADCRAFETYLNLLLTHPVIADDSTLVKFVTEPQAVPRVRLKKGFLFKLSFAIDTSFQSQSRDTYPDSDNYFQRERDWVLEYLPRLTQAALDWDKLIESEMKISKAYDHLSTTLSILIAAPNGDKTIAFYNDLLTKFRRSADTLAEIQESVCFKDEDTISSTLNVYTKYMEASRDMLQKRIGLLIDYNEAVNKLTQAKPAKKKQAEAAMVAAEKAFADCTVVAKKELRHLRVVRIAAAKKALVAMATAKRDEAQRAHDALADIRAAVNAL